MSIIPWLYKQDLKTRNLLRYDPSGEQAKEIYHELEVARCELLGEKYLGSKRNIWQNKSRSFRALN